MAKGEQREGMSRSVNGGMLSGESALVGKCALGGGSSSLLLGEGIGMVNVLLVKSVTLGVVGNDGMGIAVDATGELQLGHKVVRSV